MKWRIDYEWGECPGTYDRAGSAMFEAFNVRGALEAWDRAGGCINSRVVCVALVKEGKGKTERCDDVTGTALRVCARLADYHLSRQAAKKKRRRQRAKARSLTA